MGKQYASPPRINLLFDLAASHLPAQLHAMDLSLSTPALLFPAISLLFLAYTNRFLHLAALIRKLHSDYLQGHDPCAREQINYLHRRLSLIRWMQIFGVTSLLGCTLAMVCVFFGAVTAGSVVFILSVVSMTVSLSLALWEISISGGALQILLSQLENTKTDTDRSGAATRSRQ